MSTRPSKYNISGKLWGTDHHFLMNVLSGSADILTREEHEALESDPEAARDLMEEKGYWVDPEAEKKTFRAQYLEFSAAREREELQIFYTPTYACNFACGYCFQSDYAHPSERHDAVVTAFFDYIDKAFQGRRKYITLFGGEPLMPGEAHRAHIAAVVDGCRERGLELAVVTNGYHLLDAIDLLARARIKEIQVTLDGLAEAHDSRRPLKGGGSSFDTIVMGVDAVLARDLPLNLRMVVDRENIDELGKLAHFAVERGWTSHPRFKTQLGRNYNLHNCQASQGHLYDRLELAKAIAELAKRVPEVAKFHRASFHGARYLFDNGELPDPTFDACPACKSEWAFDASGRIFPCTATVGVFGEELGRFHPTVELNEERIAQWQDRSTLTLPQCQDCEVNLVCGGGCEAIGRQQHGAEWSPDCRPVADILGVGLAQYFVDDL